MRPLRFTIFLATPSGLLVVAVYLWTPLIVPDLPNTKLARPSMASNSIQTVEAGPGVLRPPPLVRTERPPRKRPQGFDRSPTLKVVRLVRPPVSLVPKPVQLPVTASGVSTPTISPGAPLEHPASLAPTPSVPTAPSGSQPSLRPAPPSLPKPAPASKPRPAPRTTTPSAAQPHAQPPSAAPPAAAPEPESLAPQPAATEQAPAAPPVTPPSAPEAGGQAPPSATPPPVTTPPVTPPATPPPTTSPPATEPSTTRPGWGCGDENHGHSGPPGNGADKNSPC